MRHLIALPLAVLAFVVTALPARAALVSQPDAAGDVEAMSEWFCDGIDGQTYGTCSWWNGPMSSTTSGDLTRTNVRHMASAVVVRARVRSVDARGQRSYNATFVTDEGVRRTLRVTAAPGSLQPTSIVLRKRSGVRISCPGLRASFDGVADLVTLSVPRGCLSHPRWVRLDLRSEGRWIDCPPEILDPNWEGNCRTEDGRSILGTGIYTEDHAYPFSSDAFGGWFGPRVYRG